MCCLSSWYLTATLATGLPMAPAVMAVKREEHVQHLATQQSSSAFAVQATPTVTSAAHSLCLRPMIIDQGVWIHKSVVHYQWVCCSEFAVAKYHNVQMYSNWLNSLFAKFNGIFIVYHIGMIVGVWAVSYSLIWIHGCSWPLGRNREV